MKRVLLLGLLVILAVNLSLSAPAFAVTPVTKILNITNNGDIPLNVGAYITNFGTQALVDAGELGADGLDAQLSGGADPLPMLLTNTKILTVASLSGYGTAQLLFTSNNETAISMPIIVGNGGYFTTPDNPAIEFGNIFTLTIVGYIDTTFEPSIHDYILDKDRAVRIYVYDNESIRVAILDGVSGAEVCTATATGVESNEHTLVIAGDGSNLSITVDGTDPVVSTEPIGDGVPDNTNPYNWDLHNVMPYIYGIQLVQAGEGGGDTYGLAYTTPVNDSSETMWPYSYYGEAFTPTVSGAARASHLWLSRGSQTSGTVHVNLYEQGSEGGVDYVTPWFNSPQPFLSAVVNVSSLPATPTEVVFYWNGYHNVIAGRNYFLVVWTEGGSYPGQVRFEMDTSGAFAAGEMYKFSVDGDSVWVNLHSADDDMLFAITSEEEPLTSPTHITTPAGLQAINDNLAGNYVLDNDIDLSSISSWTPLGDENDDTYFTGRFDGQGHTISNMHIDNDTPGILDMYGIGLFGTIGDNALIRNFKLTDASIDLTYDSAYPQSYGIGLVVGVADVYSDDSAVASNIQADGTIDLSHTTGSWGVVVGGFCGYSYYLDFFDCSAEIVATSDSSANVGIDFGGFVAYAYDDKIERCSVTGSFTSTVSGGTGFFDSAAGFSNYHSNGTELDCYCQTNLNGIGYTDDPFIASLWSYNPDTDSAKHVYAATSVTGDDYDPLNLYPLAYMGYGEIESAFWDDTLETIPVGNQHPTGLGRATSQLHTQTTFGYFDFEYVWNIVEGNYPTLIPIVDLPLVGGSSPSVTKLTYEPQSIIQGNVLPDLETNQDATIHWGTNPDGSNGEGPVLFVGFTPPTTPARAAPSSPGAGPGIGGGNVPITSVTTGTWTLPSLNPPLVGDLINSILDNTVFGRAFFWYPVALLILLVVKFWAYRLTFTLFIKLCAGLVCTIFLCALSLLPWLALPLLVIWDFTIMTHSQRGAL